VWGNLHIFCLFIPEPIQVANAAVEELSEPPSAALRDWV
jgi:hypothetical protein